MGGRDSQHHEVAIQRGTPIREEEGRGGEDLQEIPRPCPRHCREITQSSYWRFGQEKVPGPLRSHCWSVLLPHQEEDQPPTRGRPVLLSLHRLLGRECLRQLILHPVWTLDFSTSENEKN